MAQATPGITVYNATTSGGTLGGSAGGGYGGGPLSGPAATRPRGGVVYKDAEGNARYDGRVQIVGNKALYRRANQWVDPSVTPEEEKKAEKVEQFSDKYFELARNNARLRQYLAMPDGCTVRVENRVYQIVPQQNRGG